MNEKKVSFIIFIIIVFGLLSLFSYCVVQTVRLEQCMDELRNSREIAESAARREQQITEIIDRTECVITDAITGTKDLRTQLREIEESWFIMYEIVHSNDGDSNNGDFDTDNEALE